jgi:hypothetical protein
VEARRALRELRALRAPPAPHADPSSFAVVALPQPGAATSALTFASRRWRLELDPESAAIIALTYVGDEPASVAPGRHARRTWATREWPLAEITYSTYDEASYGVIWDEYAYQRPIPDWFYKDFGKPGSAAGGAARRDVRPRLRRVWRRAAPAGGLHVVVESAFPEDLVAQAGAPAAVWTEIRSLPGSNDLLVDVIWENKTATRLPEALWVAWRPDPRAAADPATWTLSKMGQPVRPGEVLRNGSWSLHALDDGGAAVAAADGSGDRLRVRSLDAALASPGRPALLPNLRHPLDMEQGVAFCLHNNLWGTNYPGWYPYNQRDRSMRFRFVVQVEEEGAPAAAAA